MHHATFREAFSLLAFSTVPWMSNWHDTSIMGAIMYQLKYCWLVIASIVLVTHNIKSHIFVRIPTIFCAQTQKNVSALRWTNKDSQKIFKTLKNRVTSSFTFLEKHDTTFAQTGHTHNGLGNWRDWNLKRLWNLSKPLGSKHKQLWLMIKKH